MQPLEQTLGYYFQNKSLLEQALTHSSYSNEHNSIGNNERLEFLGDAVLEFMMSQMLFKAFPDMSEGDLTKMRAKYVCESSLAGIARRYNVGRFLRLSRGEAQSGGADRGSLLSDALEAVLGAVYLDGGVEAVQAVVDKMFLGGQYLIPDIDHKTKLQEFLQKNSSTAASYVIIKESGPDHHKLFTAQVRHCSRVLGQGEGKTKKEAEQNAAAHALNQIRR